MQQINNTLSIAIPVYNFADMIPATLESLIPQAKIYNIEIMIFDGCSTDNTQLIIQSYQKKYPLIRYIKALNKGGIDVDMAKTVDLARGKYCWLFSGDDICVDGSISFILSIIEKHEPDLILGRHNECNKNMEVQSQWPILDIKKDRIFNLNKKEDRSLYLEKALTSEAFFSFMTGLIINRQTWLQGILHDNLKKSNWAHVARLWALIDSPFILYYSDRIIVNRRGENDSFSNNGMLERLKIQIIDLQKAVKTVSSNNEIIKTLKRVIKNEVYPNWSEAVRNDLKALNANESKFKELDNMLKEIN